MTELSSNVQNINSHYTSGTKATRPQKLVVNGPQNVPSMHLYNDIDARKRISAYNAEIEQQSKEYRKNPAKQFWKVFLGICAGILGIIGIKKLIHFFK